jgi:uncharacterized protein (DUF1499 family)
MRLIVKSALSKFLFPSLLTFTLSTLLWLAAFGITTAADATPYAANPAVLPGLNGVFTSARPDNLGIKDNTLAACPATPNCVVSQGADAEHAIAPIPYSSTREAARQNLIAILGVVPRTKLVEQTDDYLLAESESRLMGFVDDSEFYLPKNEAVIHMRSAARLGESDFGVNRRRLEQIRLAFQDLEQRLAAQSKP